MSNVIEENNKGKIFIKRLIFMVIFQIILVCVLVSRFVFLQIINYDSFKNKSQNNSVKFFVIPPLRGNFLDRNNVKLTNNRKSYNVFLYREKKNRIPEGDIENVANILNLSPEEQNRVNKQLWSQRDKMTVNILSNLTWDKLINLEKNSYRLKNISVEEGHVREYLFPNEMSHIIGYVSAPNEGDIARLSNALPRDVLLNPDFKVGKNGLESALNGVLTGSGGYRKVEVNANNVPLREMEKKLPAPANDMRLTIDINLQQFIFKRMEGKSGGVVVLNVNTGEILAMVSTPSFNGNDFVDGISNEYWNELLNNPQKPLYNKTITGLYSPGSTFKPIVALAALESNSWNEKKTYVCAGKFKLGKTEFNCWTRHAHGSLNIVEALERSCNPFFINLALSTEINKIFEVAGNLGIGEHFDLNLSEFKDGILPTKDWKYKTLRDVWVKGDTANMSIGHGFLLVNPLQMAVVVSRIANGGYPIKPY
ncbi:MAG: penicillin-binding protein 2, partial [Rickettsiales bacterium]|nr:penicillin-binding protein 2 [Rickettsiales bacterium]